MLIFETKRLRVRSQDITDAEPYFLLHGDAKVMKYIRPAKNRQECFEFLQQHIEENKKLFPLGRFLAEEKVTSNFVGSFVIIPFESSPDFQLGYALLPNQWNKGFATELVMGGVQYIFSNTELKDIYAVAETGNSASQNVLLKTGFKVVGEKLEKDVVLKIFKRTLQR